LRPRIPALCKSAQQVQIRAIPGRRPAFHTPAHSIAEERVVKDIPVASKAFDQQFPRGWFGVLFSDELAAGQVRPLRYFGRDYVVYRGHSGQVAVLDAHCPHLGAHLGDGRCQGDNLVCPFHAWTFGRDGRCIAIPYSSRMPPKARSGALAAHPVRELNQIIHLWFDPQGGAPDWDPPAFSEMNGAPGWTQWYVKRWRVRTQGKEIIENLVDGPHFAVVHQAPLEDFTVSFDGRIARHVSHIGGHPTLGRIRTTATYYGPALQYIDMEGSLRSCQVNFHTPVDHHHVDLCYAIKLARDPALADTDTIAREYAGFAHAAFEQDIRIWENKIYRPNPLLCESDGPLFELRHWYRQFFDAAAAATAS
jgi:3-ketosteroid 9alpha-monooxygenase subunit A